MKVIADVAEYSGPPTPSIMLDSVEQTVSSSLENGTSFAGDPVAAFFSSS